MHARDKQFLSLMGITTLGMLIEFTMTFADQVIVSHRLGEAALAAVGLAYPLDLTLDAICAIFSSGAIIRYLSAQTSDNDLNAKDVASTALYLSAATGLFFGFTVWIFRWNYLSFFDFSADNIAIFGHSYLEFIAFSMMLQPLVAFVLEFNWINEQTWVCILSMTLQLTVNIIFSWILSASMGTAGAAMGTALGYLAAAIVNLSAIFCSRQRKDFGIEFSYVESLAMIRDAAGDMACPILSAALTFLMSFLTVTYFSDTLLPVTTLLVDLGAFMMVFEGISLALENIVGKAFAERDFAEIRQCMRLPLIVTIVLAVVAGGIFLVFSRQVLTLMGIAEAELLTDGLFAVRAFAVSIIGFALFRIFDSYYAYIERPGVSLFLTSMAVLVMPVLGIVSGAQLGGYHGFIIGYCVTPLIAVLFVFLWECYRYGWRDCPLLLHSTRHLKELEDGRQHHEWSFYFTKNKLVISSLLLYGVITALLWNYWTNNADYNLAFQCDVISRQLKQMDKAGMSDEVLQEYIANGTVLSDCGTLFLLADDENTIVLAGADYQEFIDQQVSNVLKENTLAKREFDKLFHVRHILDSAFIQKMKVRNHTVVLYINDSDVYWERNRSFYFSAVSLFFSLVILLTVALRGSRKEQGLDKGMNQ